MKNNNKYLQAERKLKMNLKFFNENNNEEEKIFSRLQEIQIEMRKSETTSQQVTELEKEIENLTAELEDIEKRKKADSIINDIMETRKIEKPDLKDKQELKPKTEERRGKELMEGRAIMVSSSPMLLENHKSNTINPTFNQVSTLLDRVSRKPLQGGESFDQSYIKGYGSAGYSKEGEDYNETEPKFGYATIVKTKITAYSEETEEVTKLPVANYSAEIQKNIGISIRKKITKEILIGNGGVNELVGIFNENAKAIEKDNDISISEITDTTLDEIIYSFGGDEDVEDEAVLILNKSDLKAFSKLRTKDGKKVYEIKKKGNTGTIDGLSFIINSACKAISDTKTKDGDYSMAYGPLSNYTLAVFSDLEIKKSDDFKFRQGQIAHRGSIFLGGNVTAYNGFLRVKKCNKTK